MQLLSAFSRPQTVPAVTLTAPRKTLWILNSWRDLILYVGTPLFLLPMFLLAQARWSAQDIYLFVGIWRSGPSSPGNDPRVRRSRIVQTISVALYFRADF